MRPDDSASWNEIASYLNEQMEATEPAAEALSRRMNLEVVTLMQIEPGLRSVIDAACERFAETGHWPSLPPEQAALSFVRMGHATLYAEFLAGSRAFEELPQDQPMATFLKFLLVDYWHFAGRHRWIVQHLEFRE